MYAVIENEKVVNIVVASVEYAQQKMWIELEEGFGIGDLYIDGEFSKAPDPLPQVPQVISYAQGKRAMIRRGYWQLANAYVDSIEDETERLLAQSALHDPTEFHRTSPFLNYLAGELEIPDSEIDEMFTEGAADII